MLIVLALFTLLTMAKSGINYRQRLALLATLFFATLLFAIFPVVASIRQHSLATATDQNVTNIFLYLTRILENRLNFFAKKRSDERYSEVYHRSTKLQFPAPSIPPEQQQIKKLISALRKSGLFGAVAGAIDGLNLVMLPQQTTIFVPTDSAFQSVEEAERMELFQYHVVIQRFAFAQLFSLNAGDTLPTLLAGNSILVTSNQIMNFTLDDVRVISPDLYYDSTIVVHGIGGIFNYTLYGKGKPNTASGSPPPQAASDIVFTRSPDSTSDPSPAQSQTGLTAITPSQEDPDADTSAGTYRSPLVLRFGIKPVSELVTTSLLCGAALFFGCSFLRS